MLSRGNLLANDWQKRSRSRIWNNRGQHRSAPFQQAKDRDRARDGLAAFALAHTTRSHPPPPRQTRHSWGSLWAINWRSRW